MVAMDAETGDIRAMVGGRDFDDSKFNRATQALRQPGSTFKPFVYSAAIRAGHPAPRCWRIRRSIRRVQPDGTVWEPNDDENTTLGMITLRQALALSLNLVTIRLGLELGAQTVVDEAHRYGITTPVRPFPSMFIGSADVIPLEMVSAYTGFAEPGTRAPAGHPPRRGRRRQRPVAAAAAPRARDGAGAGVRGGHAAGRGPPRHRVRRRAEGRASPSPRAARPARPTTSPTSGSSASPGSSSPACGWASTSRSASRPQRGGRAHRRAGVDVVHARGLRPAPGAGRLDAARFAGDARSGSGRTASSPRRTARSRCATGTGSIPGPSPPRVCPVHAPFGLGVRPRRSIVRGLPLAPWRCCASRPAGRPVTAPPIPDGAVLIDDRGLIAAVGPDKAVPRPPDAQPLEFPDGALVPGFVNCHTHLELSQFAGQVQSDEFPEWIRRLRALKDADSPGRFSPRRGAGRARLLGRGRHLRRGHRQHRGRDGGAARPRRARHRLSGGLRSRPIALRREHGRAHGGGRPARTIGLFRSCASASLLMRLTP